MKNFALIGAGGYIAPRHLQAIADTGNRLVAAVDPKDSVGVLDRYFPEAEFFTEIELFEKRLELNRRRFPDRKVDYVGICSPNYLHDSHIRLALKQHAHAICEKPLVIDPSDFDTLEELEAESDRRVYTILQLRLLPTLVALKKELEAKSGRKKAAIELSYITRRGPWYDVSWKGDPNKSGGVGLNIGVHFFDLLLWIFGPSQQVEVHLRDKEKMAGRLELEWATVNWFLSVDKDDLPDGFLAQGKPAFRSLTLDGNEIEFSGGFTDLHTEVYKDILSGGGFSLAEARPAVELVHSLGRLDVQSHKGQGHSKLRV